MHIFVKTQFEGCHCWASAPAEVAFLRNEHRHIFKVKLSIEVKEDDRELEFFMVKKRLDVVIEHTTAKSVSKAFSCEQFAKQFLVGMRMYYPNRNMKCSVDEDGENGAVVSMTEGGDLW